MQNTCLSSKAKTERGGREGEREKGHPFNNMARSISLPDIDPTAGKVRPNGRRAFG